MSILPSKTVHRRCYNLKAVERAVKKALAKRKAAKSAQRITPADIAKIRGVAAARGCPEKAETWISAGLGSAAQFVQALAAQHRRIHRLFPDGKIA
jgi:hypothetical protein